MFETIQKALKKTIPGQGQHKNQLKSLNEIVDAHALLSNPKRSQIIDSYRKLLDLSPENYRIYCQPLVEDLAEFVQLLPETRNSYYSQAGGLLDHSLERTVAALERCRSYFLPGRSKKDTLTQPQILWAYTLFTAALLYGIGKIITDLRITLKDSHGQRLEQWHPLDGPMDGHGSHYSYEFENKYDDEYKRRLTLLLARQLMPEAGFRWISSHPDVLAIWLAILDDDMQGAGTWGQVLIQSDAHSIQNYWTNIEPSPMPGGIGDTPIGGYGGSAHERPLSVGGQDDNANAIGKAFIEWLARQVANGHYKVGQAPLLSVGDNITIADQVFQDYIGDSANHGTPIKANWKTVQGYFVGLGLSPMTTAGKPIIHHLDAESRQMKQGAVLLKNPNIIDPNYKTGQSKAITSDGRWTSTNNNTSKEAERAESSVSFSSARQRF